MRKRLITPTQENIQTRARAGATGSRAAVVEFTSEDREYPIESAFVSGNARGWRAAAAGVQTIRLIFDPPQSLTRISLLFEENETARTQEFVLQWSADGEETKDIVRQQWSFSPPDTIREVEEYRVQLSAVTVLALVINPDIGGGDARASLKNFRVC